jgi:hypothetical protein
VQHRTAPRMPRWLACPAPRHDPITAESLTGNSQSDFQH